jgi:tyrosine-specific transport protein
MKPSLTGGILLIIGTSIGGGMLALPVATAQLGLIPTLFALIACWAIMTISALLLLEVNLWHSARSNLISMAHSTLGWAGQSFAWLVYLCLLYALLSAYIAGGGDVLRHLLLHLHIDLGSQGASLLFTGLLSLIVYQGIECVAHLNRGLMWAKLLLYLFLVGLLTPFISTTLLTPSYFTPSNGALFQSLTVIITSFGFAIVIPSLRIYFREDTRSLRRSILIGSVIPLICYLLWVLVIRGVIPKTGEKSLTALLHSGQATGNLMATLGYWLNRPRITQIAQIFTSVCLATSFLGVSLSLFDFLRDGCQRISKKFSKRVLYLLTFIPPLILVWFYPNVFIQALSQAGILCILLLILLPVGMAWSGRSQRLHPDNSYRVFGGKILLFFIGLLACGLLLLRFIGS